ncbi:MAG TPA: hypothetical protein VK573_12750 [Gemmatimonadales bacterium]|nr:hypothetical protein [Gemmatimonadales bacterium]
MKAKSIALFFFLAAAVADCDSRTGPPVASSLGAGDTTRDTTPPPPPPPPGDTTPPPPPPPPPGGSVAVVRIVPESASMTSGDTGVYLFAVARDSAGNQLPRNASWSTSDSNVLYLPAHLGETMRVLGRAAGVGRILATVEGKTGVATITVRAGAPVAHVSVLPANMTLPVRSRVILYANLTDAAGTELRYRAVSWTSSDTSVFVIVALEQWEGQSGARIETRGPGTATLRATSEGQTGEATITVYGSGPVASVSVVPSSADFAVGDTVVFSADVRDGAGNLLSDPPPSWAASDTTVVTLQPFGSRVVVYGRAPGRVTLSATAEGKSGTASIVVR